MAKNKKSEKLESAKEAGEELLGKGQDIVQMAEKEIRKDIPKVMKGVDEKVQDLEAAIRKEPLKAVGASFLLGLLIGRMMK